MRGFQLFLDIRARLEELGMKPAWQECWCPTVSVLGMILGPKWKAYGQKVSMKMQEGDIHALETQLILIRYLEPHLSSRDQDPAQGQSADQK
jgi:hypothetical protein